MALLPDSASLLANLVTPHVMRRVVESVDPKNPPVDFKPHQLLIMVGGGKGAGKTTLREHVINLLEEQGVQRKYVAEFGSVLFDDIFSLPGGGHLRAMFDLAKGGAKKEGSLLARATDEVFARAREQAYAQKSPLLMDYHMDDPARVRKLLDEAKGNGYETMFTSVSVSLETALQRVIHRQAKTGRRTNPQAVLRTHKGFATELPSYFGLFDVGMVFDNNGQSPRLIAMSKGGDVTILDGEAYERATEITKEAGGVVSAEAHEHHRSAMAGGERTRASEGTEPARQRGFTSRLADNLMNAPPQRL